MSCWPGCSYVIVMESLQLWCVCSLSDLCASLARYLEMWNALICVHIREAAALMAIFEVCVQVLQENNSAECWKISLGLLNSSPGRPLTCHWNVAGDHTHIQPFYMRVYACICEIKLYWSSASRDIKSWNCSHACLTFTVLFTVILFGIIFTLPWQTVGKSLFMKVLLKCQLFHCLLCLFICGLYTYCCWLVACLANNKTYLKTSTFSTVFRKNDIHPANFCKTLLFKLNVLLHNLICAHVLNLKHAAML